MRFDIAVTRNGYAWWYIDALSDDGVNGLTIIAFIGSVFSPYYAWSKRRNPFDHCALNVALYSPGKNRWAMTERGRDSIEISERKFQLGASALHWDGRYLTIKINETTAPIPKPVRGEVIVDTKYFNTKSFSIDDAGRHRWRPISPAARITAHFIDPDLKWSGRGYLDTNDGDVPLEKTFRYWDWSRGGLSSGATAILYNCDLWDGEKRSIALKISDTECIQETVLPGEMELAPTKVWRIKRRTRADAGRPS
ncbi:MAG: carotenoid 1,2-hydratase, partial [Pseudomonadota bacterium]